MSDYREQTARPSTGNIGTPALGVRQDTAADISSANLDMAMLGLDSGGSLRVAHDGGKATYWHTSQFACDSTATDIAQIIGNATTVVKVMKIFISTVATGAATGKLTAVRRSTANTAGTAVAASSGKADSRNATASSIPNHYTAHPTSLGTAAGIVAGLECVQQAAGTPQSTQYVFDFSAPAGGQAGIRLNGVAEFLSINADAALGGAGNLWDITWLTIEEPTTA